MTLPFDEEFARRAVERNLLSQEQADACLERVRADASRSIADEVLEGGLLDLTSVLHLAGETTAGGEAFGEIAVRKGFLTPPQLEAALAEQRADPRLMLGQLLLRTQRISTAQFLEILRHQRAAAVRRIGKYELSEIIGEGGMGVVYKSRDTELGRLVALKVLREGEGATRKQIERFHREAQNAARLHHPAIVTVYEAGRAGDLLYFTMELIDGTTLDRLRLEHRAAAQLVECIARAVHYAHGQGIVHRDLKPPNIMVDREVRPHILDFGLSRAADADAPLTRTGAVMGTPQYMAPEQVQGRSAEIDARTDVYALGVILYQLLSGRLPFGGDTAYEIYTSILNVEPAPLGPRIHRDLATVCFRAMDKDRLRRYGTAEAFADDLLRYLQGEPILARPTGAITRIARRIRRQPALWAGLALCALAAIVGSVVGARALRARAEARETEERATRREAAVRRYEEALDELRRYETALPFADDAGLKALRAHLDRAKGILTQAIDQYPEHAPLHLLRARAHYLADEVDSAAADLGRSPEDPEELLLRGKILIRRYQSQQGLPPSCSPAPSHSS